MISLHFLLVWLIMTCRDSSSRPDLQSLCWLTRLVLLVRSVGSLQLLLPPCIPGFLMRTGLAYSMIDFTLPYFCFLSSLTEAIWPKLHDLFMGHLHTLCA